MDILKRVFLVKTTLRYFSNSTTTSIMKYLNVAEKNDAAKNIAAILSQGNSTRVIIFDLLIILSIPLFYF